MFDGPDEFVAPPVELVILAAVPLVELVMLVALAAIIGVVMFELPPYCWQYVEISPWSAVQSQFKGEYCVVIYWYCMD